MPKLFSGKWLRKALDFLIYSLSFIIFIFFDFLDLILCILFNYIDGYVEGKTPPCYCKTRGKEEEEEEEESSTENEVSETLYKRKHVFREMGFSRKFEDFERSGNWVEGNRWSDCGCESCVSWMKNADQMLHVVVQESSKGSVDDSIATPAENVVFVHGFLSSSLFWTETVFHNLSETVKDEYRLFAVDLLGFGISPKPRACLYSLRDHVEMIEKSVIHPFQLKSFHLVAHSMGCVIALALAAKYSNCVKSITLVASPYFPSPNADAGTIALTRLAGKSLWPPILFGSAVMSWYEHLCRCVCFLICRNHKTWEKMLKLFMRRRDLHFMVTNLTQHTHHSAWHTMHNVICGGAKFLDEYLETLSKSRIKVTVVQGCQDQVVPLECSNNIKKKVPDADIKLIANTDHGGVVLGRQKDFTRGLEHIWASTAETRVQGW